MLEHHHPKSINRTKPTRTNNACGSCRFRKVKCSGSHPCTQCAHLGLQCAYTPPFAKRKNGTRGALVKKLQEKNVVARQARYVDIQPCSEVESSMETTTSSPATPTYSPDFFLSLVPDYEQIVYPMNPIITADEIRAAVSTMGTVIEDAALVYAFAAVTMIFLQSTRTSTTTPEDAEKTLLSDLIHRGLVAYRASETHLNSKIPSSIGELHVTVKQIMTCMFLDMAMLSTGLINRGFVMLREAIVLLQTLKVNRATAPPHEIARCQRLYWDCFLHERFLFIISSRRSAILPPLRSGLPLLDPTIPPNIDAGFGRLVELFCVIDNTFIYCWGGNDVQEENDNSDYFSLCCQRPGIPDLTADWVEQKQAELDAEECKTAELMDSLTELQHVDIFITRLWLRTLIWQLALSRGLLRSAPPQTAHEGLSLHFPADRLSAQLRGLVCRLQSATSIATHGSGMLQKLFEITTTIADVLALPFPPGQQGLETAQHRRMDDFVFLVRFLFKFDKVQPKERRYIRDRLDALRTIYGYEGADLTLESGSD